MPPADEATKMTGPFETTGLEGLRTRRCAIAFADLVESERITGIDEMRTVARWRSFKAEARQRWLPNSGGRLLREVGDGLLLEFENARQATDCAAVLHRAMASTNEGLGADQLMTLRVGVHVGDVMFDDRDVYGLVPTMAHRVTSLAQPGETLVSAAARDELVDGLHGHIEDLGPRHAKHGDEPIRVFRVAPAGERSSARPALPRPPDLKPTLAVVPFLCVPADKAHDALGHALADDIIAALSRHPSLRVISRLSTAALRDASTDWVRLREMVGATYVLSGRCYPSGARLRLGLELADTSDGEVIWADSARADVQALFDGTDELVPHVVGQVARHIVAHELSRVRSLPMDSLRSYALYLGAEGLMYSLERRDFERSREVLEHLVQRHPRQASPRAMLARWHVNNIVQAWTENRAHDERLGREQAERALDIDPEHTNALSAMGLARMNLANDVDGAREFFLRVLAIQPQDAHTWAWLSGAHSLSNDAAAACDAANRALLLSPLDPDRYLFEAYAAMANVVAGRYDTAASHARQSVRAHMLHAPSHLLLVGSLWLAGQAEQARDAARRFLQACPGAHAGKRTAVGLGERATWREHLGDAVRAAGVPGDPS